MIGGVVEGVRAFSFRLELGMQVTIGSWWQLQALEVNSRQ